MSDRHADYASAFTDGFKAGQEGSGDPPPLTLDDVRRMSQDEINSQWGEVQKVLRGETATDDGEET